MLFVELGSVIMAEDKTLMDFVLEARKKAETNPHIKILDLLARMDRMFTDPIYGYVITIDVN